MKILSLHAKNFLSYYDETIDFSALDYVAVSGPNGSGKSSIPDALAWAFYGSLRVAGDGDSVVNDNATEAMVTVVTGDSDGNPEWMIVRRRNSKSGVGKLKLYYHEKGDWKEFGDQNNATAQKQIDTIIGLDKDAFYSLVVMESSAGTRFTQAKGTERRDILLSLVPELSQWSERERLVKNKLVIVEPELADLQSSVEKYEEMRERSTQRIEQMEAERDEMEVGDLDALDRRIEKATQKLAAASSGKSDVLSEYEAAKERYESALSKAEGDADLAQRDLDDAEVVRERFERLQDRLEQLQTDIQEKRDDLDDLGDPEEFDTAIEELEDEIADLEEQISGLKSKVTLAKQVISESKERIDLLKDSDHGECYVCHTHLSKDKIGELIKDAEEQRENGIDERDDAEDEIEKLERRIGNREGEIKATRRDRERLVSSRTRIEAEIKSMQSHATGLKDDVARERKALPSEADIDLLREKRKGAVALISDLQYQWEEKDDPAFQQRLMASESEEVDRLTTALSTLRAERKTAMNQLARVNNLDGAINEARSGVEEMERKLDATRKNLATVSRQVEDLKFLQQACSPRGVPSMLLDSILAQIEEKQNEILASLPGTDGMQVEFRQSRENKKGTGARPTLDIIVHTPNGKERRFESFSAGERVKLTISNLFAMIGVFNARHPGLIETLFLDEPLGVLDTESVPAFVEVLRTIMSSGIVSSIFVIAHDDRVIESLPQRLMIERGDTAGSKITVLS